MIDKDAICYQLKKESRSMSHPNKDDPERIPPLEDLPISLVSEQLYLASPPPLQKSNYATSFDSGTGRRSPWRAFQGLGLLPEEGSAPS